MMMSFRFWILRKLIGDDMVIANVHTLNWGKFEIRKKKIDQKTFVFDTTFRGITDLHPAPLAVPEEVVMVLVPCDGIDKHLEW
jgi:hypothetical protein